ncbi:MAG: hypothetical protein RMI35_03885 [Leptospiraceae bacterium]|nr:hypothetical protein [Leptospiraceae bacterium]
MKKIVFLFLIIPLSLSYLEAGPKEGVMSEFRAVEEGIRRKFRSEKEQMQTLQNNLLRAMKMAIQRRFFYEGDKYLKDLTIENLSWEAPLGPNIYYVKYKFFIVRFDFANDPRFFIQAPIYEKFLIMDEFSEEDHDKEKDRNTAPPAPNQTR